MKKIIGSLLVLGLGLMLLTGCQSASTSTSTTTPNAVDVANSVGGLMSLSTQVDGTAKDLMGFGAAGALKAMAVASDLTYDAASGWWTFTYTVSTVTYTYRAKAFDAAGTAITTAGNLPNSNKLALVCTMTMGATATYHFGTDASPLTFDGLLSGTKSINGAIDLSATNSGGSFTMNITYTNVVLDASGIPASGTASFSFSSSSYTTVAAAITFTGNQKATLAFSAPPELAGSSYRIDLLTGVATKI